MLGVCLLYTSIRDIAKEYADEVWVDTMGKDVYKRQPVCTDVALALGLTACEACLFIGSVGALDPAMRLGDIVVPESSVCGDGTSRYLLPGTLAQNDPFGMRACPDAALNARLIRTCLLYTSRCV